MNNLGEVQIAQEITEFLPNVHIDPFFTSNECEYEVEFDNQKYASLLRNSGVSDTKLREMNIYFKKDRAFYDPKGTAGSHNMVTGSVVIYPEFFWNEYKKFQGLIYKAIEGKDIKKDFEVFRETFGLINPERMWSYLSNPSIDSGRKQKYIDQLFGQGKMPSRNTNSIALHEAKHKIDYSTNPYLFALSKGSLALGGLVGSQLFAIAIEKGIDILTHTQSSLGFLRPAVALYIQVATGYFAYGIDPTEISARKFQKLYGRDRDWNVLNLKPKSPNLESQLS